MIRLSLRYFFIAALVYEVASAEKINQCQWFFSDFESRVKMVNSIADKIYSAKTRESIKTRRGDIITFDFIPGSLKKEPILISGGLWYKIQYFELFTRLTAQQSLIKEAFSKDEKILTDAIKDFVVQGHPIIISARSTQPESIVASLEAGVTPSFMKKPITLDDHAQDIAEVITNLRVKRQIGAKSKIQLISLSFGVTTITHLSSLIADQIAHKHIIAPLSKSGDNFPKESAIQDQMIKATNDMANLWKYNPLMSAWAKKAAQNTIDMIYNNGAAKYSSDLIKNALQNDSKISELEKTYPGISDLFKKGLQNDMDSARPDRFSLDDPSFFEQFKNSTIYLAGDEDPARLKSQLYAYLKIKQSLGKESPNLVIMDDALHAITATAPIQTSHILTSTMANKKLQKSDGSIYYMHRVDPSASIKILNQKAFDLIIEEINSERIGSGMPSILEFLFFNPIFRNRQLFHAQAIQDLVSALEGKKPMPVDFKEKPERPFEKLQYVDLSNELKESLAKEITNQQTILETLKSIEVRAQVVINSLSGAPK